MRSRWVAALAVTALLVTAAVGAVLTQARAGHRPDLRSTVQHDADALLAYGAPGVVVGVDAAAGGFTVRSGYGDVGAKSPVPQNAQFRIGSNTKTFVAATLLQLVGEDRLSLDDTVERWLPGVVTGSGNDGSKISVRQLLQHTSGLPDYVNEVPFLYDQQGFEQNRLRTLAPAQLVALAMERAPLFVPGTSWSYSNTNYVLAGMIIGRVTGRSWQQEVQARIVGPLGLHHTFTPGASPVIPGPHAVGYHRFPAPDATPADPVYSDLIDTTQLNPSWAGAAGEMISTTEDDNRFLRALVSGRVLRPAQLVEMETTVPESPRYQESTPGARYGLGLTWIPNSCGGSWAHWGDIQGFRTRNGVSADGSRSVVISINTDTLIPADGAPTPTKDVTLGLLDHALCGAR